MCQMLALINVSNSAVVQKTKNYLYKRSVCKGKHFAIIAKLHNSI